MPPSRCEIIGGGQLRQGKISKNVECGHYAPVRSVKFRFFSGPPETNLIILSSSQKWVSKLLFVRILFWIPASAEGMTAKRGPEPGLT